MRRASGPLRAVLNLRQVASPLDPKKMELSRTFRPSRTAKRRYANIDERVNACMFVDYRILTYKKAAWNLKYPVMLSNRIMQSSINS